MFLAKVKIDSINIFRSKYGGIFMVCIVNESGQIYSTKGRLTGIELSVSIFHIFSYFSYFSYF